jgi:glycine C-acetyltransferase
VSAPAVLSSPQGARVVVDGVPTIMLGSNDYLGLARHPDVVEGAIAALRLYGAGAAINPPFVTTPVHEELAERLARFTGTESALLYASASAANAGVLEALVGEGDTILSDRLNHASIIDGCRLSRAKTLVYASRDADSLAEAMQRATGRKLVISDGVFSMEGDVAPLPELLAVTERHGALLVIDECHAAGVIGPGGRGTAAHFGIDPKRIVVTGTLSKAIGGAGGGYVAGPREAIAELRARSRAFIFTSAMSPADAGASLAALSLIEREPVLVERLHANAGRFRAGLARLGLRHHRAVSPITPILIGEEERARAFAAALRRAGVYIPAMTFPIVARGDARLRAQPSAALSEADIDEALERIGKVAREFGLGV